MLPSSYHPMCMVECSVRTREVLGRQMGSQVDREWIVTRLNVKSTQALGALQTYT